MRIANMTLGLRVIADHDGSLATIIAPPDDNPFDDVAYLQFDDGRCEVVMHDHDENAPPYPEGYYSASAFKAIF